MSVAAAIRQMLASGLSLEQALMAAEIAEAELRPVSEGRSSGAERQARYRERQKALRVTSQPSRDVTSVTSVTERNEDDQLTLAETLTSKPNQETPKKSPPMGGQKKGARASRLPDDWQPSDADKAYAESHGIRAVWLDREVERFRNHWLAKSGAQATKTDWPATWRNWILTAAERGCPKGLTVVGGSLEEPRAGPTTDGRFYAVRDSPQFEAWSRYQNRALPTDKRGGWYFPSEWPPEQRARA